VSIFSTYHNVHADAYSGFDELLKKEGIVEVGCWAHARRIQVFSSIVFKINPKRNSSAINFRIAGEAISLERLEPSLLRFFRQMRGDDLKQTLIFFHLRGINIRP